MRSRVLVRFGGPLIPDDALRTLYGADPGPAAIQLTEQLDEALRAVTVLAPDFETSEILDTLRSLCAGGEQWLDLDGRADLARRIGEAWERRREDPGMANLMRDVTDYSDAIVVDVTDQFKQNLTEYIRNC